MSICSQVTALDNKDQTSKKSDIRAKHLLTGSWRISFTVMNTRVSGIETFTRNLRFKSRTSFKVANRIVTTKTSGTWKIEKGYLLYKILNSSVPKILPVGTIVRQKILILNKTTFRYKDKNNDISTEIRITNKNIKWKGPFPNNYLHLLKSYTPDSDHQLVRVPLRLAQHQGLSCLWYWGKSRLPFQRDFIYNPDGQWMTRNVYILKPGTNR